MSYEAPIGQITVLIADDHTLFCEGLVMLLAQEEDMRVVGEATDGLQALRLAEALQPDILLLDIYMPGVGGLEILPRLRVKCPKTKVLILSGFPESEFIEKALQEGAKGCLSKTLSHKELARAIRATQSGEVWAERKVLTQVLESLRQKISGLTLPSSETQGTLTEREQEIVKWVVQGKTNKEIATQLGISAKTVQTHLSNVFNKLKISRRLQLLLHRIVDRTD